MGLNERSPTPQPEPMKCCTQLHPLARAPRLELQMPYKLRAQVSFFTPEFADPASLTEGAVGWLVRCQSDLLFPSWLFGRWAGSGRRGRKAWPAAVLISALILASREGETRRRAMCRRLKHDTSWRAACGLEIGGETPDESTFRRFEKYLQKRDPSTGVTRILLLQEHIIRLCQSNGVVGKHAVWAMDSTPMWCFGAVHGTFRLLGDGLRSLCRRVARWTGRSLKQLADDWELPLLLSKSTKGYFRINWKDADARADATDELVRTVLAVQEKVRSLLVNVQPHRQKKLLKACRQLAKVICDDLETDEEGRMVVARRVASNRIVSISDPEARSSHKSKSRSYKGYKVHVLGDIVSGLIASVSVTAANVGDGRVAHRLIRRARQVVDQMEQVLGDTAYCGAELRVTTRVLQGVDILAPPQPLPDRPGRFGAKDFDVDIPGGSATCPAGLTVELKQSPGRRWFSWSRRACRECELRPRCLTPKTPYKNLILHPYHEEIATIRERWSDPVVRTEYRKRSQCERLVNEAVRRGCRNAKAWGLQTAQQQAYVAAIGNNLALMAKALAARPEHAMAA